MKGQCDYGEKEWTAEQKAGRLYLKPIVNKGNTLQSDSLMRRAWEMTELLFISAYLVFVNIT